MSQRKTDAVLFDLDGTLVDTAPDMVGALNLLCRENAVDEVSFAVARAHVSNGSRALVNLGFPNAEESVVTTMISRFLEIYRDNLCIDTQLFQEMHQVLEHLEHNAIPWGIVTNKPGFLTDPLIASLNLSERARCVVSGDTVAERKPHAMPLLHACELMAINPANSIYVGDAERDIVAGQAAGMHTLAASYGYILDDDDPANWNAEGIISRPLDIFTWLQSGSVDQNEQPGPADASLLR